MSGGRALHCPDLLAVSRHRRGITGQSPEKGNDAMTDHHLQLAERESADALPTPFEKWCFAVEARLGHDLDGDQERDGYSIDGALEWYRRAIPIADVVKQIRSDRLNTIRRRIVATRRRLASDATKIRTIAARSPDCGEDLAKIADSITDAETLLFNMESAIR